MRRDWAWVIFLKHLRGLTWFGLQHILRRVSALTTRTAGVLACTSHGLEQRRIE